MRAIDVRSAFAPPAKATVCTMSTHPRVATDSANCQTCFKSTHRRCSVCHVCVYCSMECEEIAERKCQGRAACTMHVAEATAALRREATPTASPYSLHDAPVHYVMAPSLAFKGKITNWSAAVHAGKSGQGAEHFVKFLLAWTPPQVSYFSCFGVSLVGMSSVNKLVAGVSRLRYAHVTTEVVLEEMIARHLRLGFEIRSRDGHTGPTFVIIGSVVKCKQAKSKHAVHLDLLEFDHETKLTSIAPLWVQLLVVPGKEPRKGEECLFNMPFEPKGFRPTQKQTLLTDDLRELTADDLKELGFKMGDRKRVLKWGAAQ